MIRRFVNAKTLQKRMFSSQGPAKDTKGKLRPILKMISTEKRRFGGLIVLSLIHSSMFLSIPLALKEI